MKKLFPFLTAMYSRRSILLISEPIFEKYYFFYLIASGTGRKGRFPEIFSGCRISLLPFPSGSYVLGNAENPNFEKIFQKNYPSYLSLDSSLSKSRKFLKFYSLLSSLGDFFHVFPVLQEIFDFYCIYAMNHSSPVRMTFNASIPLQSSQLQKPAI